MKKVLYAFLILFNSFFSVIAQNNNGSLKTEKIYLHTDRDTYISGEYLSYKLYIDGNPGQLSKYAYLIIRDKNNSYVTNVRLEIIDRVAFGTLFLPDTLSTGIYQMICYTNCMRNYPEETYFNKEIVIANRFDKKLNYFTDSLNIKTQDAANTENDVSSRANENLIIHPDKLTFSQREKISFSIESGKTSDNIISNLSVSVSEIVPGISRVPSISEYFHNISIREKALEPKENVCYYYPEVYGPVIQGRVLTESHSDNKLDSVNPGNSAGTKNYIVLISTADSIVNMQYTKTDSLGSFRIHLNPYYEGKDLFIKLKENAEATIDPDNKFILNQPFYPSEKFNIAGIRNALLRGSSIVQIQKFYNKQATITDVKDFYPGKIVPRVYFNHYSTIFPADFIELNDFIEISKEIVPALKVRKTGDRYVSGFINFQDNINRNAEPEIFLDGVPVDDISQIINLGTSQINRIETLQVTRVFGEMYFSGILAVFSKNILINKIQFKTPAIKLQALLSQAYSKPELFKPTENRRHIPDLRQLLLWEPEIILQKNENQQVECYASDLPGKYRINVQGITSDGFPVNGSAIINVISKPR